VLTQEVAANEHRWGALLRNVQLLVIGIDRGGRIDYVNPHLTVVSGYSADEVVGRAFIDIAPPEPADLSQREWTVIHGSIEPHVQTTLLAKAGPPRTINWSSVLLFDRTGDVTGTLNVGVDVTEQLNAEQARDQALNELQAAMQELQALKSQLEEENIYLKQEIQEYHGFSEIIGESNALLYVLSKVQQVAGTDATVLVEEETEVGKELIARAIHQRSRRSGTPFIKVNCAVLPTHLIESELFGHELGAFTGATRLRKGRFELADGGTAFLDEISELPLELQAKLLRVLQEREFERVGGSRTLTVDV
jgi:formate hydrogenlyase transcriptional activator